MNATEKDLTVNGIRLHVVEQGKGPLVILCHGWPELAYSWRHQIPALAAAGYHVVAPDMRGFGASEAPPAIEDYTILHNVGDMVALVAACGEQTARIVGHDWGAPVAWASAMLRPDLFTAVAGLSVPHSARPPTAPLATLRVLGITRFYWQYFQEPGVAEAEFEADVGRTMRIILGGQAPGPKATAVPLMLTEDGGFLDMIAYPETLPDWLTEADLAIVVRAYQKSGFRGGLNWYRNIDRNWALLGPWQDVPIRQPALFIAGSRDPVINLAFAGSALTKLSETVPGLRRSIIIDGAGHWIQQEKPDEVNAALLAFLAETRAA